MGRKLMDVEFKSELVNGGRKNTKFLHKAMIHHRQRNIIFFMKNEEGLRQTQHKEMEDTLVRHFKELLMEPQEKRQEAVHKICN